MSELVDAGFFGNSTQTAFPDSVRQIAESERLVLWAFRRWVAGPEHLSLMAREFDRQFRRGDGRPALVALDAALVALSRQARRTIVYHQPCCPCLGADEVCFLSIVAASQAGAETAVRAMAQWLIHSEGVATFLPPLEEFTDYLTSSGHDLPYRIRPQQGLNAITPAVRPVAQQVH